MSELSTEPKTDVNLADIPGSVLTANPSTRWQRGRDWLSDCFSSIMVKEARQSLKSYQFFITYTIVIFTVAIWTILMFFGESTSLNQTNWEDLSKNLFYGYCVILGVPLCLIVPFSAFRSLAREYEDGTIQLISITTMKPYQIVLGKLSTAMLQMVIYLAVIAPCIALTYMLDAISYPLIAVTLLIAVGGSIFLTILGLLLAGASRSYALGMAISVFFVLGLGALYLAWWGLLDNLLSGYGFDANMFQRAEAMIPLYGMTAFFGSLALLMLTAAASQISFDSDNRSTPIRIAMLIQLTLFLGMMVMSSAITGNYPEFLFGIAMFSGHFWLIVGCMLVSERPGLSHRVQRTLPKSVLGRSFFSLLMPGPGRGYLFAVGCMFASILATAVIIAFGDWFQAGAPSNSGFGPRTGISVSVILTVSLILCLYPLFYLSLVYLWMRFLRAFTGLKGTGALAPFIGLLSGALFLSSISLAAYALWYNFETPYDRSYYSASEPGFLGCFNWYLGIWTVGDALFNIRGGGSTASWNELIYLMPFGAVAMITTLAAVLVAIGELRYQPTAAPTRVAEDIERNKAERHAAPALPAGESIDEIFGALPDKKEKETE